MAIGSCAKDACAGDSRVVQKRHNGRRQRGENRNLRWIWFIEDRLNGSGSVCFSRAALFSATSPNIGPKAACGDDDTPFFLQPQPDALKGLPVR